MADDAQVGIDGAPAEAGVNKIIKSLQGLSKAADQVANESSRSFQKMIDQLQKMGSGSSSDKYEQMLARMSAGAKSASDAIASATRNISSSSTKVANSIDKMVNSLGRLGTYKGPSASAIARTTQLFEMLSGTKLPSSISRLSALDSLAGYKGPSAAAVRNTEALMKVLSSTKITNSGALTGVLSQLAEVARATSAAARASTGLGRAAGAAGDTMGGSFKRAFPALSAVNMGLFQLELVVGTVVETARKFANGIMRWDSAVATLDAITHNSAETQQEMQFLIKTAETYGVALESITKSYASFRAAGVNSNMTLQQTQGVFTGLTQAARVYGLTNDQTARIMQDMVKIMARGTLQLRELGQMERVLPTSMIAFSAALGVSSGRLLQMTKQGKVMGDTLKQGLIGFGEQMRKITEGGLADAQNKIQFFAGNLATAFMLLSKDMGDAGLKDAINTLLLDFTQLISNGGALYNALTMLASGLNLVAQEIYPLGGFLATVWIGSLIRGAGSLGIATAATEAYTMSLIRQVAALDIQRLATIAQETENVKLAASIEAVIAAQSAQTVGAGIATAATDLQKLESVAGRAGTAMAAFSGVAAGAGKSLMSLLGALGLTNLWVLGALAVWGLVSALDYFSKSSTLAREATEGLKNAQKAAADSALADASSSMQAAEKYHQMGEEARIATGKILQLHLAQAGAQGSGYDVRKELFTSRKEKITAGMDPESSAMAQLGNTMIKPGISDYWKNLPDDVKNAQRMLDDAKKQQGGDFNNLAASAKVYDSLALLMNLIQVHGIKTDGPNAGRIMNGKDDQTLKDSYASDLDSVRAGFEAKLLIDRMALTRSGVTDYKKQDAILGERYKNYSSYFAGSGANLAQPYTNFDDMTKPGRKEHLKPLSEGMGSMIQDYGVLGHANDVLGANGDEEISKVQRLTEALSDGAKMWTRYLKSQKSDSQDRKYGSLEEAFGEGSQAAITIVKAYEDGEERIGRAAQKTADAGPFGAKAYEQSIQLSRAMDGYSQKVVDVTQKVRLLGLTEKDAGKLALDAREAADEAFTWASTLRPGAHVAFVANQHLNEARAYAQKTGQPEGALTRDAYRKNFADNENLLGAPATMMKSYLDLKAELSNIVSLYGVLDTSEKEVFSDAVTQKVLDYAAAIKKVGESMPRIAGSAALRDAQFDLAKTSSQYAGAINGHLAADQKFRSGTGATMSFYAMGGGLDPAADALIRSRIAQQQADAKRLQPTQKLSESLQNYYSIYQGENGLKDQIDSLQTLSDRVKSGAQAWDFATESSGHFFDATHDRIEDLKANLAQAQLETTHLGSAFNQTIDDAGSALKNYLVSGKLDFNSFATAVRGTIAQTFVVNPLESIAKQQASNFLESTGVGQALGLGQEAAKTAAETAAMTSVFTPAVGGLIAAAVALQSAAVALGASGVASGAGSAVSAGTDAFMMALPFLHSGGRVGSGMGGGGLGRGVSSSVFSDAPRFHNGGLIPGERPIIAKDGEEVLRQDDPRHIDNFATSHFTSPGDHSAVYSQHGDSYSVAVSVVAPQPTGDPTQDQKMVQRTIEAAQSSFEAAMQKRILKSNRSINMTVG